MGQRKTFWKHRIPESSYARKETVDMEMLTISSKSD